jgi:hypothetical protein
MASVYDRRWSHYTDATLGTTLDGLVLDNKAKWLDLAAGSRGSVDARARDQRRSNRADQVAWRAARAAGIPTAGAMPKGFKTEDGPRPEFATEFGAHELKRARESRRAKV